MPGSLIQRYTYGNFADLPAFSPEADFFLGVPARQRELIALTKTQIALGREVAAALHGNTSEMMSVVRYELERQTEALTAAIGENADRIIFAIDDLAGRVTAELVEIRWQLLQLQTTSEQILEVLKRPRSTEAQELLRQGIRNLVNDKLKQAEDTFKRALDLDNTDYQVLMNLSIVELRKGNAAQSVAYLRDALTLPENLDFNTRADTLWALARVHYAEYDYSLAAKLSKESLALVCPPHRLFQYGAYLVLAKDARQGISMIEDAIHRDPGLFALAALFPDLASHRDEVEALLTSLARKALETLRSEHKALLSDLSALRSLPHIAAAPIGEFERKVGALHLVLRQPAYSDVVAALNQASALRQVLPNFKRLSTAEHQLLVANGQCERTAAAFWAAKAALADVPKQTSLVGLIPWALFGFSLLMVVSDEGASAAGFAFAVAFVFIPPTLAVVLEVRKRRRRAFCEESVKAAESLALLAQAQVKSVGIERDTAFRGASIPA